MRTFAAATRAAPDVAWRLLAPPELTGRAGRRTSAAPGASATPEVREGAVGAARLLGVVPVPARIVGKRAGRSWTWRVGLGLVEMVHRVEPRPDGGATVAIDVIAPGPLERALALAYGPLIERLAGPAARSDAAARRCGGGAGSVEPAPRHTVAAARDEEGVRRGLGAREGMSSPIRLSAPRGELERAGSARARQRASQRRHLARNSSRLELRQVGLAARARGARSGPAPCPRTAPPRPWRSPPPRPGRSALGIEQRAGPRPPRRTISSYSRFALTPRAAPRPPPPARVAVEDAARRRARPARRSTPAAAASAVASSSRARVPRSPGALDDRRRVHLRRRGGDQHRVALAEVAARPRTPGGRRRASRPRRGRPAWRTWPPASPTPCRRAARAASAAAAGPYAAARRSTPRGRSPPPRRSGTRPGPPAARPASRTGTNSGTTPSTSTTRSAAR